MMTFPISTRSIQNIGVIHAVKFSSLLLLVSSEFSLFVWRYFRFFISFEVEIFINKKKNSDPQTTCPNDIFEMRMSVKRVRVTNFGWFFVDKNRTIDRFSAMMKHKIELCVFHCSDWFMARSLFTQKKNGFWHT